MDTDILFIDEQGSGKKDIIEFFKVTTVIFTLALACNLIQQKGDISELTTGLFVGLFVCALIYIFTNTKMVTQIRKDGIYVRFPPFEPAFNKYSWENIQEIYLREFDAVNEYTGWGIKVGPAGKGYLISGDKGLQLELRNNSRVLIGTQRSSEIAEILRSLKQLN